MIMPKLGVIALLAYGKSLSRKHAGERTMPSGPRGEQRPADVIGCAIKVAKISVGEADDDRYSMPGRVRSGQAGARARADKTSPERRTEIAKQAASRRWNPEAAE